MIIQSTRISRAGGVTYLARHLLDKTHENEAIEVLAGDRNALFDAQAFADLKRCRYSVRHISISPERPMSPAQLTEFLRSVDQEFGVGLDRPRLLVRHIKDGRAHFHLAVAEVDSATFKVLDCKNDFRRLEDLARRYEADHGEQVQPSRDERRKAKAEGFSDISRKRAERVSPGFDRTKLKAAFAAGAEAFRSELQTQGLRIVTGHKGPILVDAGGTFAAAANRAAGVRRDEFQKFMQEETNNERLIGTQHRAPEYAGGRGTQHRAAPAASRAARNTRGAGSCRAIDGIAPAHRRRPTAAGGRVEVYRGQARSHVPALTGRHWEDAMLARLNRELDELLSRARELASWIMSAFEPAADRLNRQIDEARRKRKSFPPATFATPAEPAYNFRRRMTP